MINLEAALEKIKEASKPFATELTPLNEAMGRILAQNITADRDYPPFNRAAMDGIAIRYSDWVKGIRKFPIQACILAGDSPHHPLQDGYCFKIMTGAACPTEIDTVIRQEDLQFNGQIAVIAAKHVSLGSNIAKQGEDLQEGTEIIIAPKLCDTTTISLLATFGVQQVCLFKRPSIAILTTGSELVQLGKKVTPYQIRDSNNYLLQSLLHKWNPTINYNALVPDDPALLRQHIQQGLQEDLLIINGGVSTGDADFIPDILRECAVEIIFHKVAIKPGKPVLFGKANNGCIVFGLPGNPLSCLVSFSIFVETYLYWSAGKMKRPFQRDILQTSRHKKNNIPDFFPVYKHHTDYGIYKQQYHGSGDITAAFNCIGIAQHPADSPVLNAGDCITYFPF